MTSILVPSIKISIPFRAGSLPVIDPADPRFLLRLASVTISGQVNAKAARRLATHIGGAVLSGKLVEEGGKLVLLDAGFQFLDPQPAPVAPAPAEQPLAAKQ